MVDTSALIAYLKGEPQGDACGAVLTSGRRLFISAGTLAEALIVSGRQGVRDPLMAVLEASRIEVVHVTPDTAARMADAYARWGKGYHAANLNLGDCFAYALAEELSAPLLFIGNDFSQTDVRPAF